MSDRDNRRADRREDTFLELVRDNRARLRKICRVYAESTEAQDDLYQDILVQLWRALPGYEEDDGAQRSTWVYRVALNTALDHERKRDVRRDATLRDTHPLWEDGFAAPDERLETQEQTDRLYAAIDRLDDADKALATMYLDERSYAEMAEVLGISENYVGVKLHRIKKTLADELAEVST